VDKQVKIGGVRVEPAEIEAVLRQHSAVQNAVVTSWAGASADVRLVAYISSASPHGIEIRDVRDFVAASLPQAMVPNAFVVLAQFPLSPNSKIDRRALPEPDWTGNALRSDDRAVPLSGNELAIAEALAAILEVEHVTRTDTPVYPGRPLTSCRSND
jgi:hypothetical protein